VITEENVDDEIYETVKFPVEYKKGYIGVGGIVRNITERKQIEIAKQKEINNMMIFQKAAVGRELRMIELKKEINELLIKQGGEKKYEIFE
jgi:hypothetical protein